jgi:hypothetical protein
MSLNRFFFRCPRCLFKFTADAEGFRAPRVESCGVCQFAHVRCLGATKGVLSYATPCNDVCVFAEGPDCSCSCGGRNHGARLVVPVVRNVVEFTGRLPTLERARALWNAWDLRVAAARQFAEGDCLRIYERAVREVMESQSWANRQTQFVRIVSRLGLEGGEAAARVAASRMGAASPLVASSLAPALEVGGQLELVLC